MKTYVEFISELFNKPVRYKKTMDDPYGMVRYSFWVDEGSENESHYIIEFSYWSEGNYDIDEPFWEVSFGNMSHGDDGYGITNTGNEIKVFSTIVNIMKEFTKKNNPPGYYFSAKEQSRKKLYDAMIRKLAKGFKVKKMGNKYYLKKK